MSGHSLLFFIRASSTRTNSEDEACRVICGLQDANSATLFGAGAYMAIPGYPCPLAKRPNWHTDDRNDPGNPMGDLIFTRDGRSIPVDTAGMSR